MTAERRSVGASSATSLLQQIKAENEATGSGVSRFVVKPRSQRLATFHEQLAASVGITHATLAAGRRSPATGNSQENSQNRKGQ
jgi:hypothetical protein